MERFQAPEQKNKLQYASLSFPSQHLRCHRLRFIVVSASMSNKRLPHHGALNLAGGGVYFPLSHARPRTGHLRGGSGRDPLHGLVGEAAG